jgi:glycosyltransferase involved in cell wall biosynthesis
LVLIYDFVNILYICLPTDVHDRKWMTYFSDKADCNLFATWESNFDETTGPEDFEFFKEKNIKPLKSIKPFSFKNPIQAWQSIRFLNKIIAENNIDIVHLLFATPHAIWGAYINVPYIITARGSDVLIVIPDLLKAKGVKKIQNKYLFSIFKKSFNNASLVTGTSSKQVESINKFLQPKAPVELIRSGIDVNTIMAIENDRFLPEILKGKKFVFSPRYIRPVYDVELQIEALRLLPNSVLNEYYFVFIYGPNTDYYVTMKQKLANLKGLNYIILDRISQMEMWTCYKYAALTFMVPHSDGTPNTALEAMAAGCPLILRDLEAYDKDLFEGTCVKLKEATPQCLADTIVSSLTNYPEGLKQAAMEKVTLHGNRAIEMEKLYTWYKKIAS